MKQSINVFVGVPVLNTSPPVEKQYRVKFGNKYSTKTYCFEMANRMLEILEPFPGMKKEIIEVEEFEKMINKGRGN